MVDHPETLVLIGSVIQWLVSVAVDVILVVIAATTVKRHRPDVWWWIMAPALGALVLAVLWMPIHTGVMALASRFSVDWVLGIQAGLVVVMALIHGGVAVALYLGIARLARPPQA